MSRLRTLLNRLPKPVVESLRLVRTATLWLLEPLDWLHRRLTLASDRGPVPPLWIRRHSGPIEAFERAAAQMSATIAALGLLRDDDAVLDVGCGCGSMALEFRRLLGPRGTYVGFDVHQPSIRWCQNHFAADQRFRFDLAALHTAWTKGGGAVEEYCFPMEDAAADFVLAKSVFTHLLEGQAQHYLQEIRRVLRRGGTALITAFLLDDDGASRIFPYGGPDIWWSVKWRPEAGLAYRREQFLRMAARADLTLNRSIDGYWSGGGVVPHFRNVVILA
jgi:SAM-dependent methyltransferase